MSTLNQAFLRAYTRDRNAPAPSGSPVSSAPPRPHTPTTATATASSTTSATSTAAATEAAPATSPATSHTFAPHVAFAPQPTLAPSPASTPASAPAPSSVASPAVEPQFETRIDPPDHEFQATPRPAFVPAWEVDELPWPAVTDQMSAAMGHDLLHAIADRLEQSADRGNVVAITSLIRREGRSSVAASLARAAAQSGLHVALLDADLENPRLTAQLDLQLDVSWVDAVLHGAVLPEAAVRSVQDHLSVFPLTPEARSAALSWSDDSTVALFNLLRAHFDLVVADMGPLTEVLKRGLQGGSGGPLDGTVLLRDVRITGADQVLLIARELHQAGLHVVGVVDNFHELEPA
ncbi:MAG: hypothetical protein U0939_16110 [Pirellulales bacterium]